LNSIRFTSQQSSLPQKSTSSILIEQASDKQQLLRVHPSILVPLLFMQETKQQPSSSLPALLFLFPSSNALIHRPLSNRQQTTSPSFSDSFHQSKSASCKAIFSRQCVVPVALVTITLAFSRFDPRSWSCILSKGWPAAISCFVSPAIPRLTMSCNLPWLRTLAAELCAKGSDLLNLKR
jgi:hypothetical protein